MSDKIPLSALEVGRRLSRLREQAGLKQAELAKRVTWSAAVLSRAESGERELAKEELSALLHALGTTEADQLREAVERDWQVLQRPGLDHPDQDLLWNAEKISVELRARREDPDVRNAFDRRLAALSDEIASTAASLLKREHQIAFIGSIGIGKSTAICRLTGLEVPGEDGGPLSPVLEAGAGGVTICEVHLRTGPSYGVLIEPRPEDQVRVDVTDFAEFLMGSVRDQDADDEREDDIQGISKEIERAIRNMAGLRVRREKGGDGRTLRRDEARELSQTQTSVRELVVEILSRMELHRRDRRDIWYDSSSGKAPLVWLKEVFEQINNGRHPDFGLPRRLEVVVPNTLLDLPELPVRILDTKGIDRTAARADLEEHLDDSHTLVVLCSGFNDAPSAYTRILLERACDTGVREITTRAALLVLPRTGEAMACKDETGLRVETPEEGYELKSEQVTLAIQPLGLGELQVGFYNAYQDSPDRLRHFLIQRLNGVRSRIREHLSAVLRNTRSVLDNHEREQVQEVVRQAEAMMRSWIARHGVANSISAHVQDSLMGEIATAYASTIRASIRRDGEWHNLSYSHHLGYGARRLAVLSVGQHLAGFTDLCQTLLGNEEFKEARDLIAQAERVLATSYDEMLRKVQLMGQTSFSEKLKQDVLFWVECNSEWGQGPGYRYRVADRNQHWFNSGPSLDLEQELRSLVEREWQAALSSVTALFEVE